MTWINIMWLLLLYGNILAIIFFIVYQILEVRKKEYLIVEQGDSLFMYRRNQIKAVVIEPLSEGYIDNAVKVISILEPKDSNVIEMPKANKGPDYRHKISLYFINSEATASFASYLSKEDCQNLFM